VQRLEFVGVADTDFSRAQALAKEFNTRAFRSAAELVTAGIDAASVAVPTILHLPVARELMQAGVDVLIEKPLATSVAQADELIAVAEANGRIAQAGHLERFNPAVRAALPLLTQPMFFEVHRLSVFTPRSLDVDVVLDLMIHDIDIVLAFTQSPVNEVRAVGLPILSKKVDIANVRMEFESGCVANFTASRVSTERVRKLRLFQPRQYVSLDYSRQDVLVLTIEEEASDALAMDPFNPATMAASALPGVVPFKPKIEQQEPLKAEIVSFLDAVRRRSQPEVTLAAGRHALAVAMQVVEAIAAHSERAHLNEIAGVGN
jgi:predicted dehydrogenase